MRGQDTEPVLRGLGHLRIGVRGQAPQLPFQTGGADVSRDEKHRGQVLTALDRFLDEAEKEPSVACCSPNGTCVSITHSVLMMRDLNDPPQ